MGSPNSRRQDASNSSDPNGAALDVGSAWRLLLMLAERARQGDPLAVPAGFAIRGGQWQPATGPKSIIAVDPATGSVTFSIRASPEARILLDLFMPLVVGSRAASLVVGHLGQSLDGRVATPTGASKFITGREDIVHTHRLRALFDAVVVGVRTIQKDNPQLTTRHVPGRHPTRVVLDPKGKLARSGYHVLEDGSAPTVVCTAPGSGHERAPDEHVEMLSLPCPEGAFDVQELLQALREQNLRRIFIEGGGVTISRFLAAHALDRLHVSIAPMILGSGTPGFALPPIDQLSEALTLRCRHFPMGGDVLFDCQLQRAPRPSLLGPHSEGPGK